MKIGIDISQTAHEGTGVGNYVVNLVNSLLSVDDDNEYILFFSSMRKKVQKSKFIINNYNAKVKIKSFRFPPTLLDFLWNRLHILPIEKFIGDVDVFVSSDWIQPPLRKAKGVSVLYDLIVYKHPEETADSIIETQKRRLYWMKKECQKVICVSEATKQDAIQILGIAEDKLGVVYPGGKL